MQAITTKYLAPTNTKDARIKATSSSGLSVIVPYDDKLEPEQAHRIGAEALRAKLNWTLGGDMIGGSITTGYAFVIDYRN